MLSLAEQLPIRAPIVWLTTQEFTVALNEIVDAHHGQNNLYRMDAIDGMVQYIDGLWKPYLKDYGPEIGWQQVYDPGMALALVVGERGTFVVMDYDADTPQSAAKKLVPMICALIDRYELAYSNDDDEKIPTSLLIISTSDKVADEIIRYTVKIEIPLPTERELRDILGDLTTHHSIMADTDSVIRAARGMSRAEFLNSCLNTARANKNVIDAAAVSKMKTALLSQGDLLEIRKPKITINDIGGMDNLKTLLETVAWLWNNPGQAKDMEVEPIRRILLVGLQGSGKSAAAEAAADLLQMELAKTGVGHAMNKFVGESESNMRKMRHQIAALAPVCLWFDEFGRDMSGGQSSGSVDGGTTDRVHGEFLTLLQELPHNVLLMAAANRIDELPPEMLRQDRFDKIMFVGFPTEVEREEIFRIHIGQRHDEFDLSALAKATPFFTGAEIKALIRAARFERLSRDRAAIVTDDIVAMAPTLRNRIWVNHREAILDMYKRAKTEWDWASSAQERESNRILNAPEPTAAAAANGPQPFAIK